MAPEDPAGNPFEGMPFLGDLARMLQGQGPLNWDAARQFATSIASGGASEPNIDPLERIKLEQLGRVADLQVADVTGLPTSVTGRSVSVLPVTRGQWAQKTLEAYRPLFEGLAGALSGAEGQGDDGADAHDGPDGLGGLGGDPELELFGGLMKMLSPMMLGMAAGSMAGHLAQRSFGQYDLPIPRPLSDELLLVPATIDEFGAEWSLPPDDLRLWICLHEIATHAVLGVPHVRAQLEEMLRSYVTGFRPDPHALESRLGQLEVDPSQPETLQSLQSVLGDPEAILGAAQSPAQVALLPRLEALVAVVAGYVDHVMDTVGGRLLASYGMVTEALRRRRVEAAPSDRFVGRLFGLELTQALYDRGEVFVAGVVERAGVDALARMWVSARELPTPAEVDAPGLWLARIDLPDA